MNSDEAKFVLRAYRPGAEAVGGGRVMHEALQQAHRDPALLAWLGRERAFDEAVGAKVADVLPPSGLREAILIGVRASRQAQPRWWKSPLVLAVAAAVVVAVGIPLVLGPLEPGHPDVVLTLEDLAHHAIADIDDPAHGHPDKPAVLAFSAALARHEGSLVGTTGLDISPQAVSAAGCRSFVVGGNEVFEVCFPRDGSWFHLYVVRGGAGRSAEGSEPADTLAVTETRGFSVATWESAGDLYALATRAGGAALRTFL